MNYGAVWWRSRQLNIGIGYRLSAAHRIAALATSPARFFCPIHHFRQKMTRSG
jgi:hypothetical protein